MYNCCRNNRESKDLMLVVNSKVPCITKNINFKTIVLLLCMQLNKIFSLQLKQLISNWAQLTLAQFYEIDTLISNSTLLHSFVIFRVRETIFGVRGCFPVSHGQEMKDLTASSGHHRHLHEVQGGPGWEVQEQHHSG